jgi:hypothetical protein
MLADFMRFWDFHIWTIVAVAAGALALVSMLADKRRQKRNLLDNVGFMPWTGISVMATLVAVITLALALKTG